MEPTYDYKRFAVLYVDDEEKSLRNVTKILAPNLRLLTAPSGEEGLRMLREHQDELGVVISDQRMPGMQGVQLLEQARKLQPRIIRMLATAYTDMEAAVAAINSGAIYKYVSKPFDFDSLEITIKRALEFFLLQRERDALLREKLSVLHKMVITDRVLGLGVMASGLSHNLRNSMAAVRTFLELTPEMLHRERLDLDRLQHPSFWHDFHSKVQGRLKAVIEVLDGVTQFTEPPAPLPRHEVDAAALLGTALDGLRDAFRAKGITVINRVPAGLPMLKVDGERFPRLFDLLLREELNNLQTGHILELDARSVDASATAPAELELSLSDNGPGLPEEALRSVFDPFFTRTDQPNDFGIGLMASFFIVHHHGGRIEVQARPEGGLRYSIRLPLDRLEGSVSEKGGDFLARLMTNERLWEKLLSTS
jgi:two-component system probable response regulator PhcQ